MISHLWSLTDLLKRPPSLDSAADDAHPEVVLLGGEAREGERGLPQGARHQQTLGGGHRHHQVLSNFFLLVTCHQSVSLKMWATAFSLYLFLLETEMFVPQNEKEAHIFQLILCDIDHLVKSNLKFARVLWMRREVNSPSERG